jgi:hypothetical protein
MAGSPLKRQRKLGVRAEDGSVIAFPYMPRTADLPRGWRHRSPAEKIEHLLGMTLDDIAEIMSWPIAELDPFRLSVKLQVMRIILAIGAKAYLDGTLGREAARERDRERREIRWGRRHRRQQHGRHPKRATRGAHHGASGGRDRSKGLLKIEEEKQA